MLLLEASNSRLPPSPWEPVQATGAPNAKEGRDSPFSWCPQEQDGGEEWLIVGFPDSTEGISKIRLIESGSAGALIRIESVPEDQTTPETLWEGSPKTLSKNQIHEQTIALTRAATGNRLRLIFDTGAVPGWNQVDAVGVLAGDADEKIVWAVTAEASSHWTRPTTEPVSPETLQRADSPAH